MESVAILESGPFHDSPDDVRVFTSEEAALEFVPSGFVKRFISEDYGLYFENQVLEKWLRIKTRPIVR